MSLEALINNLKYREEVCQLKEAVYGLMDKFYPSLPKPRIEVYCGKDYKTIAETSLVHNSIAFNVGFLHKYPKEILGETVAHEVAHYALNLENRADPIANGVILAVMGPGLSRDEYEALSGHGPKWKAEMAKLGYPNARGTSDLKL